MAHDLDLSVSAYRKIETGETKLTVERLVDISKILETPLDEFLEIESPKKINQEINDNAMGNQIIDNKGGIYHEYSEISKKLIANYKQQIESLKKEIEELKIKITENQ